MCDDNTNHKLKNINACRVMTCLAQRMHSIDTLYDGMLAIPILKSFGHTIPILVSIFNLI